MNESRESSENDDGDKDGLVRRKQWQLEETVVEDGDQETAMVRDKVERIQKAGECW